MDCVITAGGVPKPDDPLYVYTQGKPKALLEINGRSRPYIDHFPWIALATLLGLPATSAPLGLSSDGLPINVQIIGPYLEDKTTLAFANKLADVMGGCQVPPGFE